MTDENTTIDSTTGEIVVVDKNAVIDPMAALLAKIGATGAIQVTRTVLQQRDKPFAIKFEGAAYTGQELLAGKTGKAKMNVARLANIINLETGEKQQLIMNTVLEGEMIRAYGEVTGGTDAEKGMDATGAYVGRSFIIGSKIPVDETGKPKAYRVYQIVEVSFPDGAEPTAENAEVEGVVADAVDPVNRKGSKPK